MKPLSTDLILLASLLGGTNLGMSLPTRQEVERLQKIDHLDLNNAVVSLWGRYMESDDHYRMFTRECKWWLSHKDNLNRGRSEVASPDYVRRVWPDVAKVMGWKEKVQ